MAAAKDVAVIDIDHHGRGPDIDTAAAILDLEAIRNRTLLH